MSQTLLTIDTESIVTCASFRPGCLMILYGTQTGDIVLREILPPEEEPSSFNSEDFDLDNKLQLHTIIHAQCNFTQQSIRFAQFINENQFFVSSKEKAAIFTILDNKFKITTDIDIQNITSYTMLDSTQDEFTMPEKQISKNPKIAALQSQFIQPFKKTQFPDSPQTDSASIYFAFGTEDGQIIFYNATSQKVLQQLNDAGDFISAIKQVDDLLICSSGDGTIYLYKLKLSQSFSARLEENSLPEEIDFNTFETIYNFIVVGSAEGELLKYDMSELNIPIQKLTSHSDSVESIVKLPGGIMLFGCDNGQVQILSIRPFQILGSLCENENNPVLILSSNDDYSLLVVGGASNKLFIQDMQWFVEELDINKDKIEEEFENEEQLNEPDVNIKDNESEEESDLADSTEDDEIQDVGEVAKTGITEVRTNGQTFKFIQPGAIDQDSSFSDFFAPIKKDAKLNKKDKMKKEALSQSKRSAQRQAFFKDIDSDSE